MGNVVATLLKVGTPVAIAIALVVLALMYPQATMFWLGRIGALFGWANAGVARRALSSQLESRINDFAVCSYRSIHHVDPSGARIAWVKSDTDVTSALKADGDVVIYLNPARPEGENLSRAALMYVSRKFLPRAKLYMTTSQKQSMDLFVTGRLLDQGNPAVASEFFSVFMGPATLDDEGLCHLVETYDVMDRAGLFFPVFVQELVFLGEKVASGGARKAVEEEVSGLLRFLTARANRVIGDETKQMYYEGNFCKCGLVIVAKAEKLAEQGIWPYVRRIVEYSNDGFEDVYVIGATDVGGVLQAIVEEVEIRTRLIEVVRKDYSAQVQLRPGQWRASRNRLILLRSSTVQRYMRAPKEALVEADLE